MRVSLSGESYTAVTADPTFQRTFAGEHAGLEQCARGARHRTVAKRLGLVPEFVGERGHERDPRFRREGRHSWTIVVRAESESEIGWPMRRPLIWLERSPGKLDKPS